MKELFALFLALQIICYLHGYEIAFTSNAEIYSNEITKLVEFDLFNPEKLVQRVSDPKFNLLNWLRGRDERHMTLHLDQEASIFKDLKTLAAIIALSVTGFILLLILSKIKGLRDKVERNILKIKTSVFWSGTIRSFDISYL